MVLVYHAARWVFGLGLLLTVYRFLAALTERVAIRRLAWLMVAFGGGLGWLLIALGRPDWLASMPLDFILPEGFTFLVLYAFPHIALGRTLLLLGMLSLLRAWQLIDTGPVLQRSPISPLASRPSAIKWGLLAGFLWLLMSLIVPFYVAVAWAVSGAVCAGFALRDRRRFWTKTLTTGAAVLVSAPIVIYNAWLFTSDPVYRTWGAQNRIFSPHPLHYLAAYGVPLALAAVAVRQVWRSEKYTWLALAWVAMVPFLVYLPFNLQRRLVEGVQVPLSLLAAVGLARISGAQSRRSSLRSRLALGVVLLGLVPTNVVLVAGNSMALRGRPSPVFRDAGEVAALDQLSSLVEPWDVVLASYRTGSYLPARVGARVFVGHGPESVRAQPKKALVARFFGGSADDAWRQRLLEEYGVDYVFWGPEERQLGGFDPVGAGYLEPIYDRDGYLVLEVAG
jgi:hypothetical protein